MRPATSGARIGGVGGGDRVGVVDLGAGRRLDVAVEQRVVGLAHPAPPAARAARRARPRSAGSSARLCGLGGVEDAGRRAPRAAAGGSRPAVARAAGPWSGCRRRSGSTGVAPLAEAADVLVALGADRALRLVGGVVGELGEDRVVDLVGLAAARAAAASGPAASPGARCPASSQSVGKRSICETSASETLAAVEAARPAHDQHHAEPAVGQRRLGAREREPVVGGEDHERVVGEVVLVERVEHRADALVERARAGLVGRHVAARLGRVGQVGRRQRVERVAHRGRLEVLAVGLEEADREEERLRRRARASSCERPRARPTSTCVVSMSTTWS